MGKELRVIIADNEPIPRSALRLLIESSPELAVVGDCDIATAAPKVKEQHPDLAILHAATPNAATLASIRALAASLPVAVLTRQTHPAYVRSCLAAGARAYVLTTGAPTDLFAAIRLVAHGHRYVDASLQETLLDVLVNFGQERSEILSGRECQVLKMLAYGFTNQQIATALSISRKSVDTYRQRIATKLELRDRSEIVKYALAVGLLTTEGMDSNDPFPAAIAGD